MQLGGHTVPNALPCLVSHSLTILSLLVVARMLDRELQAIELMTLAQAGWKVWTRARQGEKMFTLWSDPTVATEPSICHRCSPVSHYEGLLAALHDADQVVGS